MDESCCNECYAANDDITQRKRLITNNVLAQIGSVSNSDDNNISNINNNSGSEGKGMRGESDAVLLSSTLNSMAKALEETTLTTQNMLDGNNTINSTNNTTNNTNNNNNSSTNITGNKRSNNARNISKDYDSFMEQVSDGGFSVIVDYFSKGYLNKVCLLLLLLLEYLFIYLFIYFIISVYIISILQWQNSRI